MKLKHPDVLVAGAGPVGLFTALRLAREGLSVQVVESGPTGSSHSFALALHAATLDLFEEAGLARKVLAKAIPVRRAVLHDEQSPRGSIDLGRASGKHRLVAALPQGDLEAILAEAVVEAGVDLLWSHRLATFGQEADGVEVQVDELGEHLTGYAAAHLEWVVERSRRFKVPFLVGADGFRSLVRVRSGIDFPEVAPAETFAVFEVEAPAGRGDDLQLVLSPTTASACWPLPGGWQRWSFQLTDHEASRFSRAKDHLLVQAAKGAYPLLEAEHLAAFLAARAPWADASKVGAIRWRMAVRFERRLASAFGDRRVQLVGDATHLTGPAGMQSMNVGFLEADALARGIAAARRGGDLAPLAAGAEGRRAQWERLLGRRLPPRVGPGGDPWLAGKEALLLPCLPASGFALRELLTQLAIDWPA